MILEKLEPKNVFQYFEEICSIPHGSGDTKKISDYCVDFAKSRGLRYIQDEFNNVIIFKEGSKGYEKYEPVIIQGHIDMVCEKDEACNIDFLSEGLKLEIRGDMIVANGTTLGGDDGIAVAMALAVLDDENIKHPPLEIIFTVDEEIGMLGATALDCSEIKSRVMLNLDSEEEGTLLVGCAGGATAICTLRANRKMTNGTMVGIKVSKLKGGHSGVEINKGRANANKIIARVLNALERRCEFNLYSIEGGLKDNAIPRESGANIIIDAENIKHIEDIVAEYNKILKGEFLVSDREIELSYQIKEKCDYNAINTVDTKNIIRTLVCIPNGIQKMSLDIDGLVETSLNLGILKSYDDEVKLSFSVRSSKGSEKQELLEKLGCLMDISGGELSVEGEYPAWEYKNESKLRDLMIDIYKKQYNKEPVIEAIHAGVECGIFADKLDGLDCVSFGPDILDIHTTSERLSIESVKRTWKYVLEILENLKF